MLVSNPYLHRFAAIIMTVFGIYVFLRGVNTNEYKVLDDGSLIGSTERSFNCFKHARTLLTFKGGFNMYQSLCYGVFSVFLLLDLFVRSGHMTLPALVLREGETVTDISDFCLAMILIGIYVGGYPAAAYGLTYFLLLVLKVLVWLGTCKFHKGCRNAKYESEVLKKKQDEMNQIKTKVS